MPWLMLVPILAFFLLKDGRLLRILPCRFCPGDAFGRVGSGFWAAPNETLAAYIRAQVTACVFIGAVCTIGFLVIGVPYAVVLGIAAGVLEFIPLAGPLVIGFLAVGFAAFHSPTQAIVVLLFLVALRVAQDYVVYPEDRLQGNSDASVGRHRRHHVRCGGGRLMGVFLAIPAVAVLTATYRHYREHRAAEALIAPA